MDPALWELLRSQPGHAEIEALVRLEPGAPDPPGVRVVTRFGPVITCRLPADAVVATRARTDVRSVKAARPLGPSWARAGSAAPRVADDRRRPPGLPATGAGVVVAGIDWGLDLGAGCFRLPDGGTRLLALWDQRGLPGRTPPSPYGYGVVHRRDEIDRALRSDTPYAELGYTPADADGGSGTHGTHVLDIAAGNGLAGGPLGLAPEADLVFVHLADHGTGGQANLGDSVRLLEAIDFVARTAAGRPWVVNLSVGRMGGPHDSSTLVEIALDHVLARHRGCQVVQSAGNYRTARTHTHGRVAPGASSTFTFVVAAGDPTPNELEIWYRGGDEFAVRLDPPGTTGAPALRLGQRAELTAGERCVARMYHRRGDPNNHDNLIDVFLEPEPGVWTVTLEGRHVADGRFDAWLERDDSCAQCQPRFADGDADPATTTGTIANSHLPLIVGAYDAHDPDRLLAPFSSWGPTRDGRGKPDLCAPGRDVLAARSTPAGRRRPRHGLVRKSGTSMAAPHVTGAVALLLQLCGPGVPARTVRDLVLGTCEPATSRPGDRYGAGYLDVPALLAAAAPLDARRAR